MPDIRPGDFVIADTELSSDSAIHIACGTYSSAHIYLTQCPDCHNTRPSQSLNSYFDVEAQVHKQTCCARIRDCTFEEDGRVFNHHVLYKDWEPGEWGRCIAHSSSDKFREVYPQLNQYRTQALILARVRNTLRDGPMAQRLTFKPQERPWGLLPNTYDIIPWKRCYGVELESNSWLHFNKDETIFGAKRDGSTQGAEFYSPILQGDLGFRAIEKLCSKESLEVGSNCGFHLHLDCRDLAARQILKIAQGFQLMEPILFNCVQSARSINRYCQPMCTQGTDYLGLSDGTELTLAVYGQIHKPRRQHYHDKRYEWLNIHSYFFRNTIEIRLHHGTFNPTEIRDWINICQSILHLALKWPGKLTDKNRGQFLTLLCFLFPDVYDAIKQRLLHYGQKASGKYTAISSSHRSLYAYYGGNDDLSWYKTLIQFIERNLPKLEGETKQCAESLVESENGNQIKLKSSPYLTNDVALTPGGFTTRISSLKQLARLAVS